MKRREFFREALDESIRAAQKGFLSLQETFTEVNESVQDALEGATPGKGDFFDSYEMSYSLTLAYPREMFEQMARDQGMPYEGVETIEIATELHKRGVI
ncbi:MAG: hypothetical protein OQK50_06650 [Deltaproteobacteria bacterium]|jgi:hypothetical protein|nr:hypothetical protein [Deltaproteobacteria bacterium]MCW8893242.1 hypothetical protein [Deltaproteobacteria bacterium]MCW9049990.1 hypothetical protein [Deltaproteobacteria bacterium]